MTPLVDQLRWDRRRDPYRGRREYSHTARELADACERLIGSGRSASAVPVLRRAVDRMTSALQYLDDSSGIVGDDLQRLMGLYARACTSAPPSPKSLAGWLVKLEFDGPGWPRIMLRDFAGALGERGLAELERLVAERVATADPESWSGVFAVRDFREQLAEVSGDVDRYVAVLAEYLRSAEQYERIVEALQNADRREEAVGWARRGLDQHAGSPLADRLRDLLVELLLDARENAAAVAARRDEFERRPTAAAYRSLAGTVARTDAEHPERWALEVLRERMAVQPAYLSELIEVLLAVGDTDEAWRVGSVHVEAIGARQWLRLLELRRVTHPGEVVEAYQQVIENQILDSRDKHRYRRALPLLAALRDAWRACGDRTTFPAYLTELRVRHKRRPTFLKTLDRAGF